MEETITALSRSLGSFCNNLQSSCDALKNSVERRPIPLDSASSTFIQNLNRRVSSAGADLNIVETMSLGTVSFEELLGHCNELYKWNHADLLVLQDRLASFGCYVPQVEIDDENEACGLSTPLNFAPEEGVDDPPPSYRGAGSIMKSLEEDPLLDESLSLKSMGISDVCLATLESEANAKNGSYISATDPMNSYGDKLRNINSLDRTDVKAVEVTQGVMDADLESTEAARPIVEVLRDDYESLPSYMKSLTSWEDLLSAVEKINSNLMKKQKTNGSNYFYQDEIGSLGLGPKARTYLLLLLRLNQLAVETIDGMISYKVL